MQAHLSVAQLQAAELQRIPFRGIVVLQLCKLFFPFIFSPFPVLPRRLPRPFLLSPSPTTVPVFAGHLISRRGPNPNPVRPRLRRYPLASPPDLPSGRGAVGLSP